VKTPSRFSVSEGSQLRFVWIAGGLLIAIILAFWGWRWYDNNYRLPNKTILVVGEETYKLNYYADRLFLAAQAGGGANLTILEQTLLTDLEDEGLAEMVARDKGITVNDDEITNEIATQLGVPVGGAGSSFDSLYRQRLAQVRMSDDHYRRYTEAQVWIQKLGAYYETEIGTTDELVTLRTIMSPTKEASEALLARVNAGENFGSVAQAESTDLDSRQKDGLMSPEPPLLLPDPIQVTIDGKEAGATVYGPIDVEGTWWIFMIDERDPEGEITETQKAQLADIKRDDAVLAQRANVDIDQRMTSKDYDWANEHAAD